MGLPRPSGNEINNNSRMAIEKRKAHLTFFFSFSVSSFTLTGIQNKTK